MQNVAVAKAYEERFDQSLGRAVDERCEGKVADALKALLFGRYDWYASRLKANLKGDGTDHKAVCRILGTHDKHEVAQIAAAYEK